MHANPRFGIMILFNGIIIKNINECKIIKYLIFLIFQVFWGNAGNKYGVKKVLCFAVFLWSISTIATPLCVSNIPLLIISRIVLGLGEGLGKYWS